MEPASQSRSFLLAMVEFIILVPSSFVSHNLGGGGGRDKVGMI